MSSAFEICVDLYGHCRCEDVGWPGCVEMIRMEEDGEDADDERNRMEQEREDAGFEQS
jgi:hypothetical protein